MTKPALSPRAAVSSIAAVLGVTAWLFGNAHVLSQDAKPKLARTAAAAGKAKPRSTHTGKAKLEQGFVVLPDGRKIAVPETVKSKLPGGDKAEGWPETTGQADEGMQEVGAVADEMIAEEVSKREQLASVNPAALKGKVIKAAQPAAQQPAVQQPAKTQQTKGQ